MNKPYRLIVAGFEVGRYKRASSALSIAKRKAYVGLCCRIEFLSVDGVWKEVWKKEG